jgi:hypothetical protein
MPQMRILYLYPEAAQALAPVFPEFRSPLAVPPHFWQIAYESGGEEESALGIWLPREQPVVFTTDHKEQLVQGRALIPWRFIATIFEFELGASRSPSHVIGFQTPHAVKTDAAEGSSRGG